MAAKGKTTPKYKLTYFDARGRAESIRYLLELGKFNYEDERIDGEAWKVKKPKTHFGGLPLLTTPEGIEISQSMAVARYVAKQGNMYGDDNTKQATVDMIADTVNDFREEVFNKIVSEKDEAAKKTKMEEFVKNSEQKLAGLATLLGAQDFFLGKKPSFADVHFYGCMEVLFTVGNMKNFLDKQPKLKALYERVGKLPEIAAYIKKRKETPF